MWDLPRPGLEPVFPALAGRFSTSAPPGKPLCFGFVMLAAKRSNCQLLSNITTRDPSLPVGTEGLKAILPG